MYMTSWAICQSTNCEFIWQVEPCRQLRQQCEEWFGMQIQDVITPHLKQATMYLLFGFTLKRKKYVDGRSFLWFI